MRARGVQREGRAPEIVTKRERMCQGEDGLGGWTQEGGNRGWETGGGEDGLCGN